MKIHPAFVMATLENSCCSLCWRPSGIKRFYFQPFGTTFSPMKFSLIMRLFLFILLTCPAVACRMLGVIALPDNSLSDLDSLGLHNPYLVAELEEFRLQGGSGGWPYSNTDGWAMTGYSITEDNIQSQTVRSEIEAYEDENFYLHTSSLLATDEVPILMGHLRQTSSGADGIENPHPFIYVDSEGTQFSFSHNGDLDKDYLRELIGDDWLEAHPPQTFGSGAWNDDGWDDVVDSELFFFWIMKNVEDENSLLTGIKQALMVLENDIPNYLKNFLLSDGENLYAYRSSLADDIYYFDANTDVNLPWYLTPANHSVVMSTPPSEGNAAHLPWLELANKHLLIFRSDGSSEIHTDIESTEIEPVQRPELSKLIEAYPNPFNGRTIIPVTVEQTGIYHLSVFDLGGGKVFEFEQPCNVGEYTFSWSGQNNNGDRLDSGNYFYRIQGPESTFTGKLLLLK